MAGDSWSFVRKSDVGRAAVVWPRQVAEMFDEADLAGQFRLSKTRLNVPDGWREAKLGSWFLAHDPALSVTQIMACGSPVGWIMGQPITPDGALLAGDLEISFSPTHADPDGFEDIIHEFAGRFVAVVLWQEDARIYLDASGSMGVVFCAEQRIAASTVFLVPYESANDDRLALVRRRVDFPSDPHLLFGLTARSSVDWLMPNHYLDLETWRAVRHWPKMEIATTGDIEETVVRIADKLAANISALVGAGPVQMSLTAGNDTRVMLACSRELVGDIRFVTLAFPDRTGRTDVSVAREMAKRLGLDHRVIRSRRASSQDVARLLYRTGCAGALDPRCQTGVRTMAELDPSRAYVAASTAEVGRMPVYLRSGDKSEPVTIMKLLAWRDYPAWPEQVERGEQWLAELPLKSVHGIFDMRGLELRFGRWAGYLPYGYPDGTKQFFYPFSDRQIFEAMLSLPLEYRLANQLTHDIIALRWPELLDFPINDAWAGWYGAYRRARRYARHLLKR